MHEKSILGRNPLKFESLNMHHNENHNEFSPVLYMILIVCTEGTQVINNKLGPYLGFFFFGKQPPCESHMFRFQSLKEPILFGIRSKY